MTTGTKNPDWSKLENVVKFLEQGGRKLTPEEQSVIDGQRRINGLLFQAIDVLLKTFSDENAPPSIVEAKAKIKGLPGREPPGCELG